MIASSSRFPTFSVLALLTPAVSLAIALTQGSRYSQGFLAMTLLASGIGILFGLAALFRRERSWSMAAAAFPLALGLIVGLQGRSGDDSTRWGRSGSIAWFYPMPDGRLILHGPSLVRLRSSGTLETAFPVDGRHSQFLVQSDGNVLRYRESTSDVERYLSSGQRDHSFNSYKVTGSLLMREFSGSGLLAGQFLEVLGRDLRLVRVENSRSAATTFDLEPPEGAQWAIENGRIPAAAYPDGSFFLLAHGPQTSWLVRCSSHGERIGLSELKARLNVKLLTPSRTGGLYILEHGAQNLLAFDRNGFPLGSVPMPPDLQERIGGPITAIAEIAAGDLLLANQSVVRISAQGVVDSKFGCKIPGGAVESLAPLGDGFLAFLQGNLYHFDSSGSPGSFTLPRLETFWKESQITRSTWF